MQEEAGRTAAASILEAESGLSRACTPLVSSTRPEDHCVTACLRRQAVLGSAPGWPRTAAQPLHLPHPRMGFQCSSLPAADITVEQLSRHFHQPASTACQELGMGVSHRQCASRISHSAVLWQKRLFVACLQHCLDCLTLRPFVPVVFRLFVLPFRCPVCCC